MDYHIEIKNPPNRGRWVDGVFKPEPRHLVYYRPPEQKGRPATKTCKTKKEAVAFARMKITEYESGTYNRSKHHPTIEEGFDLWITDRTPHVKRQTLQGYKNFRRYIVGPLLDGSSDERYEYSMIGELPPGTKLLPMLGDKKVTELSTSDIRAWHKLLWSKVGPYTANQAKQYLSAILNLLAEDFNVKPPAIPKRTEKRRKEKKQILTQEQFKTLLEAAQEDEEYGLYYAFPFLTGVRPCEQLGLLWSEVDFEKRIIRICRIQERDGSLTDFTKTEAGMREIPMNSLLHDWLLRWKDKCPSAKDHPPRVFPNLGRLQQWPKPRKEGGKCLLYSNFRNRIWKKAMERNNLPLVTPHSARHFFVSTLQAKGTEVGLVAKLAGHANPTVTLGHYTQAVRGGEEAVEKLACFG